MGFYGGKDSQGQTWGPANIAGCWATAEKEMDKWIAVDKGHVDGGLTGTITDLHGVGKLDHLGRRLPRHHRHGVPPRSRAR